MEYANKTLYTIQENKVIAQEYSQIKEIQPELTWCSFLDLKPVAEHTTKKNKVPQFIAALDSTEMIFIGFKNSCSTLGPTLEPIHGLSMRDVNFLLVQGNTVAAITPSAIRILTAKNQKLDLKKSVDHSGVKAAAIAGSSLLVATDELYELIDLTIDSKIPLFPTPHHPIVAKVNAQEFLVVQGSGSDEPAMGLIVKFTGEATRQPIMWDSYPLDIHVDGEFVVALFDDKLTVHSITSQTLVKEWPLKEIWPFESVPKLAQTHGFEIESENNLIGPLTVLSHTALYHQSDVIWLVPPSPIETIETKIKNGENVDLSGLGVAEKEYAETLLCLWRFKRAEKVPVASLESIILYIFGDLDEYEAFPGLKSYIEELKSMEKTPDHLRLYQEFLKKLAPTPKIESILARLLKGEELVQFLITAKTGKELAKTMDTETLQEYYQQTNQTTDLLDLWYHQISKNPKYAKKLVDYLAIIDDKELVWNEALKLIKVVPQQGVQLFTKKSKCKFDPDLVLETLKPLEGGVAWRIYLKHLVYTKKRKVFAQELVMVVVQDLIDLYSEPEIKAAVEESYEKYRQIGWPKRPYFHFLQSQAKTSKKFEQFVDLELEFATLVKDGSDMAPLISIIDEHAPTLYVERCAVYRKLELHTQCLDFLIKDITDYVAATWYCLYDSNGKPLDPAVQEDLAKYTLKQLLATDAPIEVIGEHLEKQKHILSLEYVIQSVPEPTKLSTIGGFLEWHFEQLRNTKTSTQFARTLAMGEAKSCDGVLNELRGREKRADAPAAGSAGLSGSPPPPPPPPP